MEFQKLPATSLIVRSNNAEIIARRLALTMPQKPFTHMDIITGMEHSGRIFAQEVFPGVKVVPFSKQLWAFHLARELERLTATGEARYEMAPEPGMLRGWEIRKGEIARKPVIVACTVWV